MSIRRQMTLGRLMTRPVIRMISRGSGDWFRDIVTRRILQILQERRYRFRWKSLKILCTDKRNLFFKKTYVFTNEIVNLLKNVRSIKIKRQKSISMLFNWKRYAWKQKRIFHGRIPVKRPRFRIFARRNAQVVVFLAMHNSS